MQFRHKFTLEIKSRFFFTFLLLLFLGCKSQKMMIANFDFVGNHLYRTDSIDKIPLRPYHNLQDSIFSFLCSEGGKRNLYIYQSPSQKLLKKIPISLNRKNEIWAIRYINVDSILVIFNAAQNTAYNHDSTILLLDEKMNIKKVYDLSMFPIWAGQKKSLGKDSMSYIAMKYGNLYIQDKKIYFQMEAFSPNIGDSLFNKWLFYAGGHVDMINSNQSMTHKVCPPSLPNHYYPKRAKVPAVAIDGQNNPVYGFSHTSYLYKYDLITQKQIAYSVISAFGDTVKPISTGNQNLPQDDYTQISYERLYYHPYLNYYFRFVRLALPVDASPEEKRNPYISVIFFNTKFEKLGEGILPAGLKMVCYFTNQGIAFWNKVKTDSLKEEICFSEYQFSFHEGDMNALKEQLYPQNFSSNITKGMEAYIKQNFEIKDDKYVVFFIPVNIMCKNCVDETLSAFLKQRKVNKKVYLVLASENKYDVQEMRNKFEEFDENILSDDKGVFKKYLDPPIVNANLVAVKQQKLAFNMSLIPDNLGLINKKIEDFFSSK